MTALTRVDPRTSGILADVLRRWMRRADLRDRSHTAAAVAASAAGDPRLSALSELAAGMRISAITGTPTAERQAGAEVGVGSDTAGWFVAAEIEPPTRLRGEQPYPVDLGRLARAMTAHPTPPSAVQVVLQTVPMSRRPAAATSARPQLSGGTDASSIQESYEQLCAGHFIAVRQHAWLAVRVGAEPLATTGATGDDVRLALLAAANWARHALRRAGLTGRLLDRAGLVEALTTSLHLDAPGTIAGRRTVETWKTWQVGRAAQMVFAVAGWPRAARSVAALGALVSPTATTDIAVTLRPDPAPPGADRGHLSAVSSAVAQVTRADGAVEVQALVRYRADPASLRTAARAAVRAARSAGISLLPLAGDQAPAVYASAPTGGGDR